MKQEIADLVLQRAKNHCERCGKYDNQPALHHRKLRSQGGKDEVANLVAVCHHCHNLGTHSIHLNPEKAKLKGWIVPSFADPLLYPLHLPSGEIVRLTNEGTYEGVSQWQE